MKFGFLLLILLSSLGFAHAGDVSCQVDILKPKINAAVIEEEKNKPAKLTVAEAKLRLRSIQSNDGEESKQQHQPNNKETDTEKVTAKSEKKPSRLGGIFDILLPSKLRNPVE